jgi:hypothetical protein
MLPFKHLRETRRRAEKNRSGSSIAVRGNILFCMRLEDGSAELGDGTIPFEDKVRPEASSFSEP